MSPFKRLAETPGELECWISEYFEEMGQMQIFAYKRAGGLTGVASFLIDCGVVGLKDTWITMYVDRHDFEQMLDQSRERDIDMRRATLEECRRWIAGGARWANDNGMRLPKDWLKAASIIGGVGDWASADLTGFIKEFAGHPEDLRQRLIGQSLESFLKRNDICFIFSDDAPYTDPETGEYISGADDWDDDDWDDDDWDDDGLDQELSDSITEMLNEIPAEELAQTLDQLATLADSAAAETRAWLAKNGDTASPELTQAWQAVLLAVGLAHSAMPDADDEETAELAHEFLDELSTRIEDEQLDDYETAVDQVEAHAASDPDLRRRLVHSIGGSRDNC